jgi:hypothetical protein
VSPDAMVLVTGAMVMGVAVGPGATRSVFRTASMAFHGFTEFVKRKGPGHTVTIGGAGTWEGNWMPWPRTR